ncbi:MAG: MAPEG family protein [Myxococcales bacterium]|nr:MAPEG family protein [Myxococcales bacterium]
MTTDVRLLAYSAILTWLMVLTASLIRAGGNVAVAFGNREDLPPPTPLAGRAERAARNMIENLVLFTAILMAAQMSGHGGHDRVVLGARLFFFARVVYFPTYLAGVQYVRTGLWAVAVVGMGLIASSML